MFSQSFLCCCVVQSLFILLVLNSSLNSFLFFNDVFVYTWVEVCVGALRGQRHWIPHWS